MKQLYKKMLCYFILMGLIPSIAIPASSIERPDIVFYKNKKRSSMTYPLEDYFKQEGIKPPSQFHAEPTCTRGHIATWEIIDGKLYLKKVESPDFKKVDLRQIFPKMTEETVKAFWFSDVLLLLGPHVDDDVVLLDMQKGVIQKTHVMTEKEFFDAMDLEYKIKRDPALSPLRNLIKRYETQKKKAKHLSRTADSKI